MLKVAGAAMILFSTSLLGWKVSQKYLDRKKELLLFRHSLEIIVGEFIYLHAHLDEAFKKTANQISLPVKKFYKIAAKEITSFQDSPAEAWHKSILEYKKTSALKKEDFEVIEKVASSLGQHDLDTQINIINITAKQLEGLMQEAEVDRQMHVKMWRYLGVLSGVAFIILLF